MSKVWEGVELRKKKKKGQKNKDDNGKTDERELISLILEMLA